MQAYSIELSSIQKILEENPQGMTVLDIAKQININRNSVAKYLDVLHMAGKASMKSVGPAKVFFPAQQVPVENIMNYSKDMYLILDEEKKIVDTNKSFCSYIKKTKEEIHQKTFEEISTKHLCTKEEFAEINNTIRDALRGKEREQEFNFKKNKWFYTKIIPTKLGAKTGATIILEDITTKKETTKQLKKLNKELAEERKLFIKGPVIVFKWYNKTDWPITYASDNVEKVLGYNKESFLNGKTKYVNLIHKEDFMRVSHEARKYEQRGDEQFHHKPYRLIKKDGSEIIVDVHTLIVRNKENQINHYLCYIVDITNFLHMAKELNKFH
ncbi:PAS domain S-box protein [Candidatus Woesearchaeota archaeon]|nr:PAS domain S-box protein [Candidatus Woesearchaeota archaeon]